jgi:pectin methylesterase-like acyl-CoA thioesterase
MGSLRRENLLLGKIGVIVGVFIVLVSFTGTEVMGKDTPEQHKEAVEQEFKGWVERMGARYDAKHAADAGDSLASTQTYTFANQLRTVTTKTIVVDQKGKGNYKTVQAAVNSIKQGNKQRVVIQINPGVYRYKLCRSLPIQAHNFPPS